MQPVGNIGAHFMAIASNVLTNEDQADILSQTTMAIQQASNPILTTIENFAEMDVSDRVIARAGSAAIDALPEEMQMYITIGAVIVAAFGIGLMLALNCSDTNE